MNVKVSSFVGSKVECIASTRYPSGVLYTRNSQDGFTFANDSIGIASWNLEARESILFNPGPEATGGLDDTDIYFDFGIEWVITETFRVPLTFNYNNYDFGDTNIWRIGVRVHFQ